MVAVNVISRVVFVSVVCLACSGALAEVYSLSPDPCDLGGLDHYYYYTWRIDRPWADTKQVTLATLTFSQIRNWDNHSNDLYVHLLDDASQPGVTGYWDNQGGGDAFAGEGVLLEHYEDLPSTPNDITYNFSPNDIAALNTYAAAGRFALGFDPDCHFLNDGVTLTVTVPEPATTSLMVMGAGAVCAVFARKRRCTV